MDACAPLTWQEQGNLGRETHLAVLLGALSFCVYIGWKLDRN